MNINTVRLTDYNSHSFFGYYDVQPWDTGETKHLCMRTTFVNRLPREGDVADICIIENGDILKIAETKSWNFQQGCFLQWLPGSNDEIIYNDFNGEKYIGVIKNIRTGEKRILDMAVANLFSKGDYALSINFSRLYDYRPGYGYHNIKDPFFETTSPENDGIYLIDIKSGSGKLILSYKNLWEKFNKGTVYEDKKIVINHINFNTNGSRYVFLLRCFVGQSPSKTVLATSDISGKKINKLMDYGMASHYYWKNEDTLLIYANMGGRDGLYEVNEKSGEYVEIDSVFFKHDGHCSYSPCRNYILYDSYPLNGYRKLILYDLRKKVGTILGKFFTPVNMPLDCRCDLHPRWSPSGKYISFDSLHEGFRGIYKIDTEEAINYLRKGNGLLRIFQVKMKNILGMK